MGKEDTQFTTGASDKRAKGRPKGSRNKSLILANSITEVLTKDDYRDIVYALRDRALTGDPAAAALLFPKWKATMRPVQFELDDTDPLTAARGLIRATADGKVSPDVAATLITAFASAARIEEVTELRARLESLTAIAEELNNESAGQ